MEKKLGRNLRNARKAAGETQKEVAQAIHVAHNAISQYETGERCPDLSCVAALATHFRIPVDHLLSGKVSEEGAMPFMDWNRAIRLLNAMLPTACSEKAMRNEHFAAAYRKLQLLQDMLENPHRPFLESVKKESRKGFETALAQEPDLPEAAANLLRLHFYEYFLLGDGEDYRLGKALLDGEGTKEGFRKEYLRKTPGTINSAQREYVRKTQPTIMKLLRILRKSRDYVDLAEYYLSVRYLLAMVENDNSRDANQDFGTELVMDYTEMGNPYAEALVALIEEFTLCEAQEQQGRL